MVILSTSREHFHLGSVYCLWASWWKWLSNAWCVWSAIIGSRITRLKWDFTRWRKRQIWYQNPFFSTPNCGQVVPLNVVNFRHLIVAVGNKFQCHLGFLSCLTWRLVAKVTVLMNWHETLPVKVADSSTLDYQDSTYLTLIKKNIWYPKKECFYFWYSHFLFLRGGFAHHSPLFF